MPGTLFGALLEDDPSMTRHLISLAGAKERLHLFEANLNEDGSFDPVVDGCEGVFHTASPVLLSPGDPKADLLDPAVKGTLNVLRSCAKVPSIKRVVLTSSMTAICPSKKPLDPGAIIDETWFSDPVFLEESKEWYQLSKTLAEQAAWKFARENGIDLVTIHPGIVIGPLLQPTLNASTGEILNLIKKGNEVSSDAFFRFVDVRDVAYAHIQAFEIPSASGRYGLVGRVTYASEALSILHRSFPTLNLPKR
ncbi:hypothetical protein U1Q18_022772 [Sarracenia purpurea var. burkii]